MNLIDKAMADWTIPKLTPKSADSNTDIPSVFNNVITFITMIAGALAVIYLIYSGIMYITSAGNAEQAKKAQQGILNSIIGIIVIVLAFVIVNAVFNQASK